MSLDLIMIILFVFYGFGFRCVEKETFREVVVEEGICLDDSANIHEHAEAHNHEQEHHHEGGDKGNLSRTVKPSPAKKIEITPKKNNKLAESTIVGKKSALLSSMFGEAGDDDHGVPKVFSRYKKKAGIFL